MWSEELNKKILEGEDRNSPKVPDKAWDGMKSLLDKHLPLKKKRRRFILFLLPALLGAGLATFYLLQKTGKPDTITAQKNTATQNTPLLPDSPAEKTSTGNVPASNGPAEKTTAPGSNIISGNEPGEPGQNTREGLNAIENDKTGSPVKINRPVINKKATGPEKPIGNKPAPKLQPVQEADQRDPLATIHAEPRKTNDVAVPDKPVNEELTGNITAQPVKEPATVQPTVADSSKTASTNPEEKKSADSLQNDLAEKKQTAQRSKRSFGDKFSLNLSFGPDISAVGIDNPGQVKLQYGLGIAYGITKNLTIRTGFYAGDKKYTADSADYHTSYSINNLEKVDADCFIYEIPLNLLYNFNPVKKHSWFVSAGVSSFIMKKETYGYYYKNPWGQPQYYKRSYKNENEHLFSAIGISGGYQYKLSNKLSLLAEPYLKFPISGIGAGKVKLNNAGILFTIGYKPFSKK